MGDTSMQEDRKWCIGEVYQVCVCWAVVQRGVAHLQCYDEITWDKFDPELLAEGEEAELDRFKYVWAYSSM